MGWIGCVRCEKSRRDIVAWTFALIAPVHPVLHRVSCSYETITNAPKHYATHQHMSLGSNGVDWMCSLRKIPTWLRGTSLCIDCTSSHCCASSFMQFWNGPKCTQTLCNTPKHERSVQRRWIGFVCCENSRRDFMARTFALIAPAHTILHRVSRSYQMITDEPKYYGT